MTLQESDYHVLEDLSHEIAKAALNVDRFKEESRFSTWVQAIASRKCWEELRRRTRRRAVFDAWPEPDDEDDDFQIADDRAEENFARVDVTVSVEQLAEDLNPEEEQLLMMVLDGLDQNVIAARLGITPHAAESRRRRLRGKLRKKLS